MTGGPLYSVEMDKQKKQKFTLLPLLLVGGLAALYRSSATQQLPFSPATQSSAIQQQPAATERLCIAHYLCGGCPSATSFQKTAPLLGSCQIMRHALREAELPHDGSFCISHEFCSSSVQDALQRGTFFFPSTVERIWVDLGADHTTFYSRCMWDHLQWPHGLTCEEFKQAENIQSLAVDANKEYFGELAALKRVTPIPAAIGLYNSIVVFNHYEGPGCSSMNKPNQNATGLPKVCKNIIRREVVPLLTLELLLDLIPTRLMVEFLKIDVQGQDLNAAKSLGHNLHRVSKIYIEAQEDGFDPITIGQAGKPEVIQWFESMNFVYNEAQSALENPAIGEWNLMFDKKN